ncbi:hypothetical protein J437_LFUL003053 [Ladona fulva]|uniref:C-type lectin domain-containing protein n=1 Tax=Ladona fulva TaxID=123851 RepID=A0A8K0NZV3_LADFU|nr:hypothetical protein J437_LFUL003053 [Ladona fulva]
MTMQQKCSSDCDKNIDLLFTAYTNQSCHKIIQWSIKNHSPRSAKDLKIELKSRTVASGDQKTFHLQGILAVPPSIPAGYEHFPGVGYYKFYSNGVNTFNEAITICENDGAHLAIINSNTEAKVLSSIFSRFPNVKDWAYLGFHEMEVNGEFVTIFGDSLNSTGYMNWYPGQPDSGTEDCGSMNRNDTFLTHRETLLPTKIDVGCRDRSQNVGVYQNINLVDNPRKNVRDQRIGFKLGALANNYNCFCQREVDILRFEKPERVFNSYKANCFKDRKSFIETNYNFPLLATLLLQKTLRMALRGGVQMINQNSESLQYTRRDTKAHYSK